MAVIAERRAVRCENFPAAAATASADGSGGVHRNVAEFAGHSIKAAYQRAVGQNPGTDTLGDSDYDEIAAFVNAIEPYLRQHTGIGRVLQFHVETGMFHDGVA